MAIGDGEGPRDPRQTGRRTSAAGSGSELAGVGLQFGLAIVLFTLAGVWLDRKLGTSPLFVLVGVAVGAVGGFYNMYRKLFGAGKSKR